MSSKKFLKIVLGLSFFVAILIGGVNYIVDPYGIYKTNIFPNKSEEDKQIRFIKALKVKEIEKINSIVIGTSRADHGYNPDHDYFIKSSYNFALGGGTLYENRVFLENILQNHNLKQVLLIADWRAFNDITMKHINDFEKYFEKANIYKFLLNISSLKDSYLTIKNQDSPHFHLNNGLRNPDWHSSIPKNGHLKTMINSEKNYYKYYENIYRYKDTQKSSFEDFRKILELCYQNNIKLDIVFGPSHIRQWEAFDYYQDIETWYKWKKDVVLFVEKIAKEQEKNPYRIMDFSIYHELTAETVPTNPKEKMKYHWEASHYKKELGDIVLDRLLNISPYKDFGVELNIQNIDNHIQNLREDRVKFIDTEAYRKEVFEE